MVAAVAKKKKTTKGLETHLRLEFSILLLPLLWFLRLLLLLLWLLVLLIVVMVLEKLVYL